VESPNESSTFDHAQLRPPPVSVQDMAQVPCRSSQLGPTGVPDPQDATLKARAVTATTGPVRRIGRSLGEAVQPVHGRLSTLPPNVLRFSRKGAAEMNSSLHRSRAAPLPAANAG
jgi:hypothetical protein